ncbi:FHA domain-containing protein [Entamoeba marina]
MINLCLTIEQFNDHGMTTYCVGRKAISHVKVRILPSNQYCFTGLMDQSYVSDNMTTTSNGLFTNTGVYGCSMQENNVVMNGNITHYKRPPISIGDVVEYKYEKDRIFFKIGGTWDLLYVVGEEKKFVFICQLSHLYSRCELLQITKVI